MNLLGWLRNSASGILPRAKEPVCEGCGKPFRCGATWRGCWCGEVPVTDAQRAAIKQRYRGCLCRECLERLPETAR